MVTQPEVSEKSVIPQHVVPQFLHFGFILEVKVPLEETLVELNDLT